MSDGVSFRNNPVLRRELIERVQGAKVVVFLTIWLALLTIILVLAYQGSVALNQGAQIDVTSLGRVGRQLFEWVLFGMLVLILFLVPGLTAGAITGERERQTLVPLQMTMMRPRDIILGKLSAALAFLVLLVVAALPLLGVSYLVGGLSILDIARGLAMLIFTGMVLGSVCIWISARMRRTTASTVTAYGLAFVFAIGSFFGLIAWAITDGVNGNDDVNPPAQLLSLNPFAGVADVEPRSAGNFFTSDSISPFGGMRSLIDELDNGNQRDFGNDGLPIPGDRGPRVWVYYTALGTVLMIVSIRSAAKAVTTPADSER
jgi:ABC-type transport system involved in multi-copper enzyme maturation permease subunit